MTGLKIGYVGAGSIFQQHIAASKVVGHDPVGVYDIVPEIGRSQADKHGIRKVYDTFEDMLADKDLEAVVVCTPNKFHAEQAIALLNSGKHVLGEKPMAMNPDECRAMIAAQKKSGKIFQLGMVNRFRTQSQALKKVIEAGRCGNIYSGQTFWYRRRGIPGFGSWFTTKAVSGGGGLIDIGVHMLDLALYLMDFPKPISVSGQTYNNWSDLNSYVYTSMWANPVPNGKKDVDDYATALIRFENGATLNLNVSWALNIGDLKPEMGLRLMGDKGGVALEGMDTPMFYGEAEGHLIDQKISCTAAKAMEVQHRCFLASVRDGAPVIATAEQGLTVATILDAIYRSSETKREIRLD